MFHRDIAKIKPFLSGFTRGAVLFAPRKKLSLFVPFSVRPKVRAQGISLSADSDLGGSSPPKNLSPAALSWSSLIRKQFRNAFFFSPAFFCLAFPVETWDFFENPSFPPPLHRKFPVFHTVFHKLWKTNVEKEFRRRKRFPGCVFCRCGISCGGLCKGVSTGCGNLCRHLPDFPRISPQVFRFHSTIFPPFHPQKISPLLHDFSTKGSWKKNLRRFWQKNGFPLFLPLYNCY